MPSTISVGNDVFAEYLKIASLQDDERGQAFDKLSNDQKAGFVKVQFALQLIKRPNLTKEQKSYLLDAISKVSPDFYDKQNTEKVKLSNKIGEELESKALGIFVPQEAFEILDAFHADKKEDVALLQKYEDLLQNGMITRKVIAKKMDVNDRVNIWKTQLAYHLATGNFSKIQKEFILERLTSLSPDTFASRENLTKEEENKMLQILESNIFSVFTKEGGFAIFMLIGVQKVVEDQPDSKNRLQGSCNCRWFCGVSGSCDGGCGNHPNLCGPNDDWECTAGCR